MMTRSPKPADSDESAPQPPKFPTRDPDGRIALLTEFEIFTLLSIAVGVAMLAAIDGLFAVLGFGEFGQISGWISGVLVVFTFSDDFRAWRDYRVRWPIALLSAALSVVLGLGIMSLLPPSWPPLFTGAVAVTAGGMLYTALWFTGIRVLGANRS